MQLVCSNRPRPSVHKTGKGHQHWRRDVHHVQLYADLKRTCCGMDASEWLVVGECTRNSMDDTNLCARCKKQVASLFTAAGDEK